MPNRGVQKGVHPNFILLIQTVCVSSYRTDPIAGVPDIWETFVRSFKRIAHLPGLNVPHCVERSSLNGISVYRQQRIKGFSDLYGNHEFWYLE